MTFVSALPACASESGRHVAMKLEPMAAKSMVADQLEYLNRER